MKDDEAARPIFTQRMTVHLNGGSHYSELHHQIYRDGRETTITHRRRTDGSPKYLITMDIFMCGEDRFDNLATKGVGLQEWLIAHSDGDQP